MFLGFYFLFINNYTLLFACVASFHIYICFITLKYFHESLYWLSSVGNEKELLKEIRAIADINGTLEDWNKYVKMHPEVMKNLGKHSEAMDNTTNATPNKRKGSTDTVHSSSSLFSNSSSYSFNMESVRFYTLFNILSYDSQRRTFLLFATLWAFSTNNFFGIILNLGKMRGNFFANSIFAFIGESIAESLTGVLADKFGRKAVIVVSTVVGVFGYLGYMFMPLHLKSFFVFTAMLGFSGVYNVICIYSSESFPTSIRGKCSSLLYLNGRIATMFVPFISKFIGEFIDYSFIFSGGYIFVVIAFFMEETLGKPIIDNVPEEETRINLIEGYNDEIVMNRIDV